MDTPVMAAVLLAGVIVLTPLADRVRVPQPVLLTVFGVLAGLLPGATPLAIDPDLILPVVLPPLLFAATQRTTVTEFREHAGPVLALAVGLTVSTAAVVAVAAHLVGVPWPIAWVLGAIVSPPDPVAATAVARRLHLPPRLVTILEGEGMFNDATALVLYKVTLAAVVTGAFSWAGTALDLVLTLVVGVGAGLVVGLVSRWLLGLIHEGNAETTITVLAPFLAYVVAEELEGSGVLAVLVLGLLLRSVGHPVTSSGGWLLGRSVWSYADFLVTSLAFGVLGYELTTVIGAEDLGADDAVLAGTVVLTVVVFRPLWIVPVTWLAGLRARRRDSPVPANWRETAVVSWSGMRGVVTVATALALPAVTEAGEPFPGRSGLVVAALTCVLVTLLAQGLTLSPLTTWLGVQAPDDEARATNELRRRAIEAALSYVDEQDDAVDDDIRAAARSRYDGYLAEQDAIRRALRQRGGDEDPAAELRGLLTRATDVERELVLGERRRGSVEATIADAVLREIEGRALRTLG